MVRNFANIHPVVLALLLADRRTNGMTLKNYEISVDYRATEVCFSWMQVKGISATSEVLRVNTQRKNTCYRWRGNVTDRCNVSGWETRSLCSVRACLRLGLFNYRMNCRYQLFMHLSVTVSIRFLHLQRFM